MYIADKGKNSCPACLANHGKKFSTKDPNLPILPIHPNCRCKYIQVSSPQSVYGKVQQQLQNKTDEITLSEHDKKRNVTEEAQKINIKEKLYKNNKISKDTAEKIATQISDAKREDTQLIEQNFFLMFDGKYFVSSNGELLLDAVSGNPVEQEKKTSTLNFWGTAYKTSEKMKFDYSKERQAQKNIGGTPEGKYYIKLEEQRSFKTSKLSHGIKRSAWGDYSWSLHKVEGTDTKGRSGFFIHGGNTSGSAGCIDITSGDVKLEGYLQEKKQNIVYIYVKYNQKTVEVTDKKLILIP